MSGSENDVHESVLLAGRVTAWLRQIDSHTTGAGVDFADTVTAGKRIEKLLLQILALNTADPIQVREARSVLGELHAWLFGELRPHLDHLEQVWETLEDALYMRAPDPEDATEEPE